MHTLAQVQETRQGLAGHDFEILSRRFFGRIAIRAIFILHVPPLRPIRIPAALLRPTPFAQ